MKTLQRNKRILPTHVVANHGSVNSRWVYFSLLPNRHSSAHYHRICANFIGSSLATVLVFVGSAVAPISPRPVATAK